MIKLLLLSLLFSVNVFAQSYFPEEIPQPDGNQCIGGYTINMPGGINNNNEVSGMSQACPVFGTMKNTPYFYDGSILLLRFFPGDPYGEGYGINDAGKTVGRYGGRPFVFDKVGGDFTLLGFSGSMFDINNAGYAVGFNNYDVCFFQPCPAKGTIIRSPNGAVTNIPFLPDCVLGVAYSISENNLVTGYQINSASRRVGFVYSHNTAEIVEIDSPENIVPLDINSLGQVVGYINSSEAFYYDGAVQSIPMDRAYAINDEGVVVGEKDGKAYTWTQQNGLVDLNSLIVWGWNEPYVMAMAKDINEQGNILAQSVSRESFILRKVQ